MARPSTSKVCLLAQTPISRRANVVRDPQAWGEIAALRNQQRASQTLMKDSRDRAIAIRMARRCGKKPVQYAGYLCKRHIRPRRFPAHAASTSGRASAFENPNQLVETSRYGDSFVRYLYARFPNRRTSVLYFPLSSLVVCHNNAARCGEAL
jgi:hypothetical protein